jgi:hypothetical protein
MTNVTPVLSLLVERLGEAAQARLRVLVKTFKISTNQKIVVNLKMAIIPKFVESGPTKSSKFTAKIRLP